MRIFSIQNKHLSQVTVHTISRSTRQEKLTMKREPDRHLLGNEASGRLRAFPPPAGLPLFNAGSTGGFHLSSFVKLVGSRAWASGSGQSKPYPTHVPPSHQLMPGINSPLSLSWFIQSFEVLGWALPPGDWNNRVQIDWCNATSPLSGLFFFYLGNKHRHQKQQLWSPPPSGSLPAFSERSVHLCEPPSLEGVALVKLVGDVWKKASPPGISAPR